MQLLLLGLRSNPAFPTGKQPPGGLLALALTCVLVLAGRPSLASSGEILCI